TGIKQLFREQVRASLQRQSIGQWPDRRQRTPEQVDAELAAYDAIIDGALPLAVARGVFAKYVLGDAADTVKTKFAEQPRVEAELLFTIGDACAGLGLYDAAESHLRQALKLRRQEYGDRHPLVAENLSKLSVL